MSFCIGLVYDLRRDYLEMGFSEEQTAEFDSEETINALAKTISALGYKVERIGNIYELTKLLSSGKSWDLVFNIAEGLYGRSREAQVPALLEAFNIPYTFSDPLALALALDKAMAKKILRASGIPTPDFYLISSLAETEGLDAPGAAGLDFPLFVKPVSEGTGKGVTPSSIVQSQSELKAQSRRLLAKYNQPVLVETYLPGEEFTVGILGTGKKARALGVLEVKLLKNAEPGVYSYTNKELCEERVRYTLVKNRKLAEEASELALRAYRALDCRDAGRVDIKAGGPTSWPTSWPVRGPARGPAGKNMLHVLELNPLAGLHPTHSDLPILCAQAGMKYEELVKGIIDSAMERPGIAPMRGRAFGLKTF
ncbi:MAG: hypothetical protein M0Z48_02870 [Nitrospiraceae bacterium]|nr:hypothetical protein [Nitrospiraceae bacterium]